MLWLGARCGRSGMGDAFASCMGRSHWDVDVEVVLGSSTLGVDKIKEFVSTGVLAAAAAPIACKSGIVGRNRAMYTWPHRSKATCRVVGTAVAGTAMPAAVPARAQ